MTSSTSNDKLTPVNKMTGTKILIASMSMEIGGAETHVLELCKALQKKGLRVYVASNGGAYEPEMAACGVVHYKVPLHNKQLYNMGRAYRALKSIIIENDIRLVHAHARIPAFLCGILQRKLNFRFVTTTHGVYSTKFLYKLLSNWGEKSLAVSPDIKDYLIRHYHVPEENIKITVNGVDTDTFAPGFLDKDKSLRIMSISRLDRDRTLIPLLLIGLAPKLREKYPNIVICIVGDGDDYKRVEKHALAMNQQLNGNVHNVIELTGPQTNIHKWLSLADVFVGASRSVLEAMAAGKPVVAAVEEGYLGLLNEENLPVAMETNFVYRGCSETTSEKLYADLVSILDMPAERRAAMGEFGREFVKANYSVDRMADDAIALYQGVLDSSCPVKVRKTDILVSGYYGYNNSGDDLLLKAIVRDLKNRQSDIIITVLSKRPKATREQYGVNAIYRFNFLSIRHLLRNTRLLLTGGGSVIQDLTSTQSLIYYLWIIRTARKNGVKNMLYANGIGPIKNPANIERMRKELKKMDLITLREESSRILLEDLQVKGPRIVVTADPVFSLPEPDYTMAGTEVAGLGPRYFCVSVRDWKFNPPGLEGHVARFADYVSRKHGLSALFILMRPDEDTEISKRTMALMKEPAVLLENPQTMDSIRGIVGLSAFTLAMRLHALIYAINLGVPVVGLVYDPKVKRLMESVNQPLYVSVEEATDDILIRYADELFENFESFAHQVKEAGRTAQSLAERNADLCMELLSN